MNMSYCRFYNTKIDLHDCLDAITESEISSVSENENAKGMFKMFLKFCVDYDVIDSFDEGQMEYIIDMATNKDVEY